MANHFNLIVFDWDGTLMDSEARIINCLRAAVGELELPERDDDEFRNIIGLGLPEAINTLYPGSGPELHHRLTERYRYHFLTADDTPSELFEGAEETVAALADEGYFLAVATGKGRQGLDKVLDETGMRGYFHVTRCADETCSKPNPQMLFEVMEQVGAEPGETLMLGDSEYDMLLARNARTAGLAVSYGVHDLERLLQHEPLGHIDAIGELPSWLERKKTVRAVG